MIERRNAAGLFMNQSTGADEWCAFAKGALGGPATEKRDDPCEHTRNHRREQNDHGAAGRIQQEDDRDGDGGDDCQGVNRGPKDGPEVAPPIRKRSGAGVGAFIERKLRRFVVLVFGIHDPGGDRALDDSSSIEGWGDRCVLQDATRLSDIRKNRWKIKGFPTGLGRGAESDQPSFPQHCLNFLPDPHGQSALRPEVSMEKLGFRFGRFSFKVLPSGEA